MRQAEGMTTFQALVLVEDVVINGFANLGANSTASGGTEQATEDGTRKAAYSRSHGTGKHADDGASSCSAKHGTGTRRRTGSGAQGTTRLAAEVVDGDTGRTAIGTGKGTWDNSRTQQQKAPGRNSGQGHKGEGP